MNYGELKALLDGQNGYLHRSDLTATIPSFITLAHARVNRDLNIPELESRATADVTAGDRYIALPDDVFFLRNIQISIAGGRQLLMQLSPAQMDVLNSQIVSGEPTSYALYGNQIELQPTPESSATLEIVYQYRLAALSADTDTNDILTNYPNIYVYATMLEATPFIQADERAGMWHEYYKEERDRINDIGEDRRLSGSPLQIYNLGTSTP